MKNSLIPVFIFAACFLIGCTKGGKLKTLDGVTYSVSASLDGSKVAPVTINDTTKATIAGIYDEQANNFTFTLSYRKDTSVVKLDTLTSVQFYKAAPAIGSLPLKVLPVVINISASTKTNLSGSFTRGLSGGNEIPAEEKANLINGSWYIVLISKKFPSGIAGGQIILNKN